MTGTVYTELFQKHEGNPKMFLDVDGESVSYTAFLDQVAQLAGALAGAGVRPGDRLAVQAHKTPLTLALYGAAAKAGAVLLPLNTGYTPAEVSYFLEDAEPRLVIADPASAPALESSVIAVGGRLLTLDAKMRGTLANAMATAEPLADPVPRDREDLAAILYTSGTTGRSKGAMLTHGNLVSNAAALAKLWRFTDEDVLIHALPIFHTHGLFVAVNVALLAGATLRWFPKFDLDRIIDALPAATTFMGVPTHYTRLLGDSRLTRKRVARMRLFVSGSAPLLNETYRRFEERTGHRILERYGMTETNMNTSNPYKGVRKPGSVGLPLPGIEIRITDPETGRPLERGARGMIEVRGPNVFKGYWNMPDRTKEDLRDEGFFITGDLGQVDADGYLSVVGRAKDLIISGGYNIYPKEIELVLDALPWILESAVCGVPHKDMGEGVIAVLVPERGKMPELAGVEAALEANLAAFKRPRRLFVVDELPRNVMGKVQKAELRDRYRAAFA